MQLYGRDLLHGPCLCKPYLEGTNGLFPATKQSFIYGGFLKIGVPFWGPYYKGILLFGVPFGGHPIFASPHTV